MTSLAAECGCVDEVELLGEPAEPSTTGQLLDKSAESNATRVPRCGCGARVVAGALVATAAVVGIATFMTLQQQKFKVMERESDPPTCISGDKCVCTTTHRQGWFSPGVEGVCGTCTGDDFGCCSSRGARCDGADSGYAEIGRSTPATTDSVHASGNSGGSAAAGAPSDATHYNCLSDTRSWSDEQRQWCCHIERVGCPGMPSATTSQPYDCTSGVSNWEAGWSYAKKEWCCKSHGLGCVAGKTSSALYDCTAGYSNWEAGWSSEKKTWCCENLAMGCIFASSAASPKPHVSYG